MTSLIEPLMQNKEPTSFYSRLCSNNKQRYSKLLLLLLCCLLFLAYFVRFNIYDMKPDKLPYTYPLSVKYSYQWPKYSSNQSDVIQPENDIEEDKDIYSKIDQKYCKQDRCRFLLPITITEQESKAQLHFRQLAFLSGDIGRTIVLPNVYGSYLGSCLKNPFEFYYDKSWLNNNSRHFNYITMEDFKSWLFERQDAGVIPTGQEVYIQGSRKSSLLAKARNCFHSFFNFDGRPTVSYQFEDNRKHVSEIQSIMTSILSDEARQHEHYYSSIGAYDAIPPVDVIHLYYDRRYRATSDWQAQRPLGYAQRWIDVADSIVSQLKPFVAIHWRMERLEPVSNLFPCAQDLVAKIKDLQATNVFLLTDYPHLLNATGAKPESMSFTSDQLRPEHHQAIQYLYQHLNVTLTSVEDGHIPYEELPQENWHIFPIDVQHQKEVVDRSVLGIVDKLVAMKAQWFFAGKPGVCAKSSSFTGRISNSRIHAYREGDENIVSPIQVFNIVNK